MIASVCDAPYQLSWVPHGVESHNLKPTKLPLLTLSLASTRKLVPQHL